MESQHPRAKTGLQAVVRVGLPRGNEARGISAKAAFADEIIDLLQAKRVVHS